MISDSTTGPDRESWCLIPVNRVVRSSLARAGLSCALGLMFVGSMACGTGPASAAAEASSVTLLTYSPPPDTDSKYRQTWPKDYGSTTCQEFRTAMTDSQRFAAAADMLVNGKRVATGVEELPDDSAVTGFQGGLSAACEPSIVAGRPVSEMATAMLLMMFPR